MPLRLMLSLVSQAADRLPVTRALQGAARGRRDWAGDGRAHLEVRGMHRPDSDEAVHELEQRLGTVAGVHRVEVNRTLGRVAVTYDKTRVALDELVHLVGEIEREYELTEAPPLPDGFEHPADSAPLARRAIGLGTSAVGLGLAFGGRLMRLTPLPIAVPTLLALADSTPRIRGRLERQLGVTTTDLLFGLGGAATQAFAQQPIGLLLDTFQRVSLYAEARARRRTWERREPELGLAEGGHQADPLEDFPPRPVPLPPGPIERYGDLATTAAITGYLAALATTRNPRRAMAFLAAGLPRAARPGREAFAAQLGRVAANRGAVIFHPYALRRLDRIDTVLIDSSALLTGNLVVEEVVPLGDGVAFEELLRHAHELVDLERLDAPHERDGWAVLPVAQLPQRLPADARREARERVRYGARVLAITRDGDVVGLVVVAPELDPHAEALVAAAREAGTVVLAGVSARLDQRLGVARVVPGGPKLLASVRALQEEGRGVLLVSATGRTALAAADVGIGLIRRGGRVPWGAHVLCGPGLADAYLLVNAVATARKVSRLSSRLAFAGSAAGTILAAVGPAGRSADRALLATACASAANLAAGTWAGLAVTRRPPPVAADRTPWHALPADTVLDRLATSAAGLPEAEASRRLVSLGAPEEEHAEEGLAQATLRELANPITPALAAGAGIAAIIGSILDAAMIGTVLGVNAIIGGAQQLNANRALRRLVEASAIRVRLRRAGTETSTTADRLVPGDVIELQAGDAVPADCRVLEAEGLEVDESSLTGESVPVAKTPQPTPAPAVADRHSMLYEGTVVAAGRGIAVVVATGERTEIGRTVRIGGDGGPPESGVAARLRTLTRVTLPISIGAGVALFAVDLLRGRTLNQALGPALSLTVAAVPEGLPFVATLAELAAARRLSTRGALVRAPHTIEALGRVDVLCFDKTGTLTEGRISLRRVSDGITEHPVENLPPEFRRVVAVALRATPEQNGGQPLPHLTDRAIVAGGQTLGLTSDEDLGGWERVAELPFEPGRGYHAVLGRTSEGQRLSVKGAPEIVLARCEVWRHGGTTAPFDEAARRQVEQEVDRLARQGYRVLAVAERPASNRRDLADDRIERLHFLGLVALADPVRPTAAAAVAQLQQAGVEILMVTGDHPSTAEAIAAELNALNGRRVVTGPELDAMSEEELAEVLPDVAVFARVSPAQKARIVKGLRALGRVVAVTGDGANDAPAIRLADVGMALGRGATPAAREAADVVVIDDRIETITDAIVEGRAMWASVRDALAILLGGNLGEIIFTVGAGLTSGADVLNARQLLLVNLLTDMLPALAVAVRQPPGITPEALLAEGPETSLGGALTRDIYIRAAATSGAAIAAWLLGRMIGVRGQASTVALVALVAAQLGQTLTVSGRSPLVVASVLASLAALALVVQTPGVSHFFGCRPLGVRGWTVASGTAFAATLASVLLPRIRR
ncbi:ATPase [Carbonactinospora thermoautotrophica]|uniref:ATPase n=1 Tax=Carbonactinospora thermoautotrophica TaxID=1469144 RepID=A0A132MLU5_9ACTN|nr:cation-translocating P-type ATPase [Carbonactinospora thermoautotrophica]KWW98725.1 ATPase [Carbonactinospora thermoautotrophica]